MANFDSHLYCARCREEGKGSDFYVKNPQSSDCQICNAFSDEQRQQLATPSYRLKKEKWEAKKLDTTPSKDLEELVDPSNVSIIGAVDSQGSDKSPVSAPPPDKKPKKDSKKDNKKEKSPPAKASKSTSQPSADVKIAELDNKWSERFNRLEALIMARNLEPTFSANVKITLTHSPPSSVENVSEPFIRPSTSSTLPGTGFSAEKHQPTSKAVTGRQNPSTQFPGTGSSASKHQPASQTKTSRLTSTAKFPGQGSSASMHQPASQTKTSRPTPAVDTSTDPTTHPLSTRKSEDHRPSVTDRPLSSEPADTGSPVLQKSRRDSISSLSSDAGSVQSDRPPLDLYTEEGELSEDPDQTLVDQDQPASEEQNYRETTQGIRSYLGWSHIPEVDNTTSTSDDHPSAGPKTVAPGKVSVNMPTEEWLCKKLGKLNLTLTEGYPSRGSEAGGLAKDVFLRPPRSQSKWYGLHTKSQPDQAKVSTWSTDASKLNSSHSRIARYTGLSSTPPASRRIAQETLRRWERSAREASVVCNQAASFNRCLFRVQQNMKDQLKVLKSENKGKGSSKGSTATDELNYLLDFNSSITQAAAKSMEHLSEFVFITMGNVTLVRRDAYLSHLRTGIKQDKLTALRTAPLHISTLFPDSTIKRAEEDIAQFEAKGHSGSQHSKGRYHPYERPDKKSTNRHSTDINFLTLLNVKPLVVSNVHTAPRHSQKKEVSPGSAGCLYKDYTLKSVKSVSCVTQLSYVPSVTNVKNAAQTLPVGARLQNFWQTWLDLGAGPKIV